MRKGDSIKWKTTSSGIWTQLVNKHYSTCTSYILADVLTYTPIDLRCKSMKVNKCSVSVKTDLASSWNRYSVRIKFLLFLSFNVSLYISIHVGLHFKIDVNDDGLFFVRYPSIWIRPFELHRHSSTPNGHSSHQNLRAWKANKHLMNCGKINRTQIVLNRRHVFSISSISL